MNRNLPLVGISNVGFPQPYRGANEFFEDFIGWGTSLISATAGAAPWRCVGTNAAAGIATDFLGVNAVAADGEVAGMCQILVSSGANGDESIAQLNSSFLCTTGRVMEFVVRFRPDSITTCSQIFGMYVETADPYGAPTQMNGFGFRIVNGAISVEVKDADTTLAATLTAATVVASTTTGWVRLRASWDGQAAIRFYKDEVLIYTYTGNAIPTGLYLSPLMGVGATASVNPSVKVDYIGCSVEAAAAGR